MGLIAVAVVHCTAWVVLQLKGSLTPVAIVWVCLGQGKEFQMGDLIDRPALEESCCLRRVFVCGLN